MTSRARFWLCLGLVGIIYLFHVHLKTAKIFRNPTWDAKDEVGQFWSEFAFHYRFAKFFAEHRDWSELSRDRSVQFPDTINDWAEFTVAMEVPVGALYRWLQPAMSFHVFVVWYDCLISSLSLFAVFLLARALWRSDGAGVFASALYATLYPSYGRTVKNLFLREDFAVPLIILALFFTVRALQVGSDRRADRGAPGGRALPQITAALFWLGAMASWHLTQFVLAVGVGAAVLVYLGKGETPRMPWLVLLLAAGSLVIPVLRAKQLFLSPTFCALYALALAVWINGGRRRAILVFGAWLAVLLGLSWALGKSETEYAHVYDLFFAKLRYLGVKPDEPARLSWEARCLWEGAFNTAGLGEFWRSLQWTLPLAVVAGWKVGRMEVWKNVFIVFALLLVPLSWMVVRYFTFLGFAVAVVAAGLVTRRIWWRAALVVAVAWQWFALDLKPLDRSPVVPDHYKPLVAWINEHTPTNAVILASISESPVILASTGRPIILHSKFENRRIRERYREFLEAVYGSEEQMFAFATKYGADYFVFDPGFLVAGKDSRRYKADRLGDLDPNCAAMLFARQPQRLRYFEPVFSARGYTVFRVVGSLSAPAQTRSAGCVYPCPPVSLLYLEYGYQYGLISCL